MIYANDEQGSRSEPTPGAKASCPLCGAACLAKCGTINAWHWAHRSLADCDTWSEGETEWHRWWKSRALPEETEVTMGPHRADIRRKDGLVIELQHSSISAVEIAEREAFYGNMVWIFDGRGFASRFETSAASATHMEYEWKHASKSILSTKKKVFLDFGVHLFELQSKRKSGLGVRHPKSLILRHLGLRDLSASEAMQVARVNLWWMGDPKRGLFYTDKVFYSLHAAAAEVVRRGEPCGCNVWLASGDPMPSEAGRALLQRFALGGMECSP